MQKKNVTTGKKNSKTLRSLVLGLSLIIAGAICTPLSAQTHPALGGGTGTSADPYRIETPAHLKSLADFVNAGNGDATADVYYIVINDLDLTAYAAGEGWDPIGNYSTEYTTEFHGTFNGNYKKVTNLKINRPTTDFQGLFGVIYGSGSVKNLVVQNCDITGQKYVGGLMGVNSSAYSISNCSATGKVSGTGKYVGGLVGYNTYSIIFNCYAAVNVIGTNYVGGLVGENYSYSNIYDCYATGNVSGTANYIGGLVGENVDNSTISYCYATGKVSGTNTVGGLAGYTSGTSHITNCVAANDSVVATTNATTVNRICGNTYGYSQNNYALSTMVVKNSNGIITITDDLDSDAGMGKSRTDFQTRAFYTTAGNWKTDVWDMTSVWNISEGNGLPWLRWQVFTDMFCGGNGTAVSPYQICTAAQLKSLADFVNDGNGNATAGVYYILINDLDLTAYAAGDGWNPIGNGSPSDYTTIFQGKFNGNGKKITNLKINQPTTNFQGLFGTIRGATVENLGIENCDITGEWFVGGLVGKNYSSTLSNCYATGNVSGAGVYAGGLVGDNSSSSSLSNCYAAVNVSGGMFVGGLAGENYDNSTISNCYATGNVSGTDGYLGGLTGSNSSSSSLSNCYATGDVSVTGEDVNATSEDVGGLTGDNYDNSTISNCYATGNVSGTILVGGLVGENSSSTISNCYATGNVIGTGESVDAGENVGGLVGFNNATIKNCVAANGSVVSTANTTYINRICGTTYGTCQNNYALNTMVVKNGSGNVTITDGLNTNAGMGKSRTDFQSFAFYATAGNWKTAAWDINAPNGIWDICDGKSLPFLRWQGINCNGNGVVPITATDGIQIYPNPTNYELQITNYEGTIKGVEIYDLSGKTLMSQMSNPSQINVSHLASGIYFIKIQTDKGTVAKKFIKQ